MLVASTCMTTKEQKKKLLKNGNWFRFTQVIVHTTLFTADITFQILRVHHKSEARAF